MIMCSIRTGIYMSAADGHIYRGRLGGGPVDRVSPEDGCWHYLHGVSPDGARLAYIQIDEFDDRGKLTLMEPHGPAVVDTGTGHLDGPEWSPDGSWIYFNIESFTDKPGHAQLAQLSVTLRRLRRHLMTPDVADLAARR